MLSDTIISTAFRPHRRMAPLIHEAAVEETPCSEANAGQRLFKIRAADSDGRRSSANVLVKRMYAWRGYVPSVPSVDVSDANRVTLVAVDREQTIGTVSIGFDGAKGLLVDDLFGDEVDAVRRSGRSVCEFTKLAVDSVVRSKRVLASLFHVAHIFAHRLHGVDDLLIEVNPRHVRYYEQVLGFKATGPERLNRRVSAPAVLMCLHFSHAHEQIGRFGGRSHLAASERSLYPYFFSVGEEAGIVARLQREPGASA